MSDFIRENWCQIIQIVQQNGGDEQRKTWIPRSFSFSGRFVMVMVLLLFVYRVILNSLNSLRYLII